MQDLRSCPSCRRHHRAQEGTCPFCGRARRVSVVVPVLAALGLTACPGPVRSVYAGPPPDRDSGSNDLLEQIEAANAEAEGEDHGQSEDDGDTPAVEPAPLERAEGAADATEADDSDAGEPEGSQPD